MKIRGALLPALVVMLALSFASCQSGAIDPIEVKSKTSMGVGYGIIAVVVTIFIGVIVCIYGRCTATPYIFAIIGTLLPLIVLLIIYYLPKEANRKVSSQSEQTSSVPAIRWVFCIFCYLMALVSLFCIFSLYCSKPLETYRIGTTMSSTMTFDPRGGRDKETKQITRNREKLMTKPQIDNMEYKKISRNFFTNEKGRVESGEPGGDDGEIRFLRNRRRNDIIGSEDRDREEAPLIGPEGEIRRGGSSLRQGNDRRKLPPMERKMDMSIGIHENTEKRKLNMVNPMERTVRVEEVDVQRSVNPNLE